MLAFIALICIVIGLGLLFVLSRIDLKEFLLPNELVLGFACCGFVFHLCTLFNYLSLEEIGLGAIVGGGMLYLIRGIANYWYNEDTLGLGDVKLLAAGGLWLGPEAILIAAALGALAGFIHGLALAIYVFGKAKVPLDLSRMTIPAGPGFAVGIVLVGAYEFMDFPALFMQQ